MRRISLLVLLALALGSPATALAQLPVDPADVVADDDARVGDAPADPTDEDVPDPADDEVLQDIADEVEPGADDVGTESTSAGGVTTSGAAAKAKRFSLTDFLRTGRLDVGTVSLPAGATLAEALRLTQSTTPRALKGMRTVKLAGAGHGRTTAAKQVTVPLKLTKAGRKGLRKAGASVTVTLKTTVRLRTGEQRTSVRVLLLER